MPKRRVRTLSQNPKVKENRIRAKAARYGLWLTRSRQRDGLLVGTYGLWDDAAKAWVFARPGGYGKTLEECEEFLQASALPRGDDRR
jgi:hypothetical protein